MGQELRVESEVRMLALGDSYTIGESVDVKDRWPHQFMAALREEGISGPDPDYIATTGWTTGELLAGMRSRLDTTKDYNLVSVLIGVNNQYRGFPVESYEPELRELFEKAIELVGGDLSRVVVLSIPDYAFTPFGGGRTSISSGIDAYNQVKKNLAYSYRLNYVDITPISRRGLDEPNLVALDGLHPSGLQYRLWVEAIMPRVRFPEFLTSGAAGHFDEGITVYPNPAKDLVTIDSSQELSRILVLDLAGRTLMDRKANSTHVNLDVAHLRDGHYSLMIYPVADAEPVFRSLIIAPHKH